MPNPHATTPPATSWPRALRPAARLFACAALAVLCFGESRPAAAQQPVPDTSLLATLDTPLVQVIDSLTLDSLLAADTAALPPAPAPPQRDPEEPTIDELVPAAAIVRGSDSLRRLGIPVIFEGDTLFRVYRNVGAFGPRQRARLVTQNIQDLAGLPRAQLDSLQVVEAGDGTFNVVYQDRVINSVSPADAEVINSTADVVARRNRDIITAVLIRSYERTSLATTLRDIGIFVALLVLLVLLWAGVNKVFHYLKVVLQQRLKLFMSRQMVSGGNSQFYRILNPRAQLRVLLVLLKGLRFLTLAFLLYLYLPFLFSQLSYTRGFGERLLDYVLTPLGYVRDSVLGFIPELIFICVILYVAEKLADFVRWIGGRIQSGDLQLEGFHADWGVPTANLVRTLVYVFTLVIIWPLLPGSDTAAFQGVSVFVGLLLSLGGASTVGNAVSGVILTYMRPFQIGHRVKLGDTVGDVVSKNLLVTRIRTTKNEEITVPNGNLLSGGIVNYTALADTMGLVLHTSITIGYDVPWPRVHALMLEAAAKTPGIEATPEPFVLQKALQDWYVEYELNATTRDSHSMPRTYSALHANIQDCFNAAGVEIMSSHYLHVRTGNETTIPKP